MKYLDLARTLLTAGRTKLPGLLKILNEILSFLEAANPSQSDSLQLVAATDEELDLDAQLAECLTAEGSQAIFDGSRLRKLVQLAGEHGPTIMLLVKLFAGL